MLQAITPGDDIYNYKFNLQKKSNIANNRYQKVTNLPTIKSYKDQMTGTQDVRTCINFINKNRSINETTLLFNFIKKDSSPTSISNLITNTNNKINPNFYFNRNNKLKSIPQKLTKSNSSANMNLANPNKVFNVLSIPGNIQVKNKIIKPSASQPKFGIKQEYFENNKCNYLMLKYTGKDNSNNDIKKKKYLLIHSHKVIDSLKNYSMPDDIYGKKLVDVIQQRINSGFYQNYRFNFSQKYQKVELNPLKYNFSNKNKIEEKKVNEKKFNGNFLKDIYDNFLLPGPDNKYNYTIHKIFLSHVLEKVCKKMVEIRDKNNKVITKEEIRKEFGNEVDNLRKNLLTGQDYNIINKVYNINNDINILSIDLGRNYFKFNDMGVIDESQEGNLLKNSSIEDKDKDLSSNVISALENSNISEINKIEKIESKYKIIHKENNDELLFNIKNTMNLSNQNFSIHDSFANLYFKKNNLSTTKYKNWITSNKIYNKRNTISLSSTKRTYIEQEDGLNNVEKFILNTKKLRYALNIKESKEEKNLSFDSEGNIKNYFEVGLKLNPVFFDDILEEIQEQYDINNHIKEKYEKNKMMKEIIQYYLNKKGIRLKFNDKITQKFLALMAPKKQKKEKSEEKIKNKDKNKKKEEIKIIEKISKLIHKKINIKKGKVISTNDTKKKTDKLRRCNTEDNFWQKNMSRNINNEFYSINSNINRIQLTDNNYLEFETNSSEFSDLPSELDSEIYEMIKKKQEQKKNRDKDVEEGIYSTGQKGVKNKGGDFIITRPQLNKEKEKKKKEEEDSKKIKEEKIKKEDENNKNNLNTFLNIDEKGEIASRTKEKASPKKEDKTTEINILKNKEEENKKTQTILKPKIIDDFNKDKKIKEKEKPKINNLDENKNKKIINKKLNKSISDENETNASKTKKYDTSNKLTTTTKSRSDIESKNSNSRKQVKKDLDKKPKEEIKSSNIIKEKPKEKEIKETKLPDIINKHQRNVIIEPIYKDINIDKEKSNSSINNKDIPNFSLNNEQKNISPSFDDKNNNINDSSINPTSDHLSIVGVMNIINLKEKTQISNKPNEEKKSNEEELYDKENEEIIKAQKKQNTSFYNDSKNNKILNDIRIIKEEKETNKRNRGNSPIINQKKNFLRIKYLLDKYDKENKIYKIKKEDKKEDENNSELSFNYLEEEDNDDRREERKRRRARKTKGMDVRKFFIDENILKDALEKEKNFSDKLPLIFPKKEPWEDKFKNFKLYINKLKGMNQEEFKNDLFKFLHEEDKIDFGQKERLNMVDRINKYKAFIISSKKNKLLYNRFHSSRILFAPGCIFNTDNIF